MNEYISVKGEMKGDDGYNRVAWVVSSAESFDDKCKNSAQSADVRLVNGLEFAEMLLDVGIEDLSLSL